MRPAPDEPRFSPVLALASWFAAALAAFVVGSILIAALGYGSTAPGDRPLWLLAVIQIPYWIALVGGAVFVSRHYGTGSLPRDYGLSFRAVDVVGFPIGVFAQIVLVPVVYFPLRPFINLDDVSRPARELADRADGLGVMLLIGLVVIAAPVVEELFYRGLVQRSLEARWDDTVALIGTAVLFAFAHFELLQFPALLMFGLLLGLLARWTGRLGMGVFAHAGFNATTVFLLLHR